MPKSIKKHTSPRAIESVLATLPAHRAGLPAKDAIAAVTTVAGKYTIIHTQEMDQYEKGAMGPGLAAAAVPAPPTTSAAQRGKPLSCLSPRQRLRTSKT